jgi:HK97 family phage major capsid protein
VPVTEIPAGGLGAAITPEQWAGYVLEHLSSQSVVLASGATRVTTGQKVVHIPRVTADGSAAFYGELEEIGPGDPTGDELVLTPKKCAALTTLSDEAVSDSSPSVLDAVGTAMTRAVALVCDRAFLTGADPKGPQGVYAQAG